MCVLFLVVWVECRVLFLIIWEIKENMGNASWFMILCCLWNNDLGIYLGDYILVSDMFVQVFHCGMSSALCSGGVWWLIVVVKVSVLGGWRWWCGNVNIVMDESHEQKTNTSFIDCSRRHYVVNNLYAVKKWPNWIKLQKSEPY